MVRKISIERCRNIGVNAHINAGKTSILERMVFHAGFNQKMGETSDWIEQKEAHGVTQNAVVTAAFWRGMAMQFPEHHLNMMDTPDQAEFTVEMERSMRVLDAACMVYCAAGGIQPQSELIWHQANKHKLPRLVFVNKMDGQGANFFRVVEQIMTRLHGNPVPLQVPIGTEELFEGVVDLVQMKAIRWNESSEGTKFEFAEIPSDLLDVAQEWRTKMIETAAEASEDLMNRYLDGGELSVDEIKAALRQRTMAGDVVPVLCGSASKNKGIQSVLDAFVEYLPSPLDIPPVEGLDEHDQTTHRPASDDAPLSALAFKLVNDPYVGQLTFFRVYSGMVKSGDTVYNPTKGRAVHIGRLVQIHGNQRAEIPVVHAGDIAAAAGLSDVTTGDTLSDQAQIITLERMKLSEPIIELAVRPHTRADQEKMGVALNQLTKEDPAFSVMTDGKSGQTVIAGMSQLQLEAIVGRMKREFSVEADVGAPQVAYRETIRKHVEIEGKHDKHTGGKGQYGHVWLRLEPLGQGACYEFVDAIKGGVIAEEFIPAVDQGIRGALLNGVLAGYPVVDIKVTLFDGSYNDMDSSAIAFETAASMAFKDGLRKASPILLEPIMMVVVETPEEYMADVMGDLSSRRGVLQGMDDDGLGIKTIKAEVPLAEMLDYSTVLRSLSQGRATYSMEFRCYSETPRHVVEAVISRVNN